MTEVIKGHDLSDSNKIHSNLDASICGCKKPQAMDGVVVKRAPNITGNLSACCGAIAYQTGTCTTCSSCGATGGCG